GIQPVEAAGGRRFGMRHRSRPEAAARIALPVVEAVALTDLLLFGLGDDAQAAGLEVEGGEGAAEGEGDPALRPRHDGADGVAEGVAAVLAGAGIEGVDGVAFDVDPVEELPARIPDGAFAEPRLRVQDEL